MAKKKQNNNVTEKPKKRSLLGLIFLPVGLVLGILSYLFLSVLVSTGIEWAGMLFGWWDYRHSELVLRQELHYLGDNFSSTLFGTSAAEAAQRVTRYFQQWLVLPQDTPPASGRSSSRPAPGIVCWRIGPITAMHLSLY